MQHSTGGPGQDQLQEDGKPQADIRVPERGEPGGQPSTGPAQDGGTAEPADAGAGAETQPKEQARSMTKRLTVSGLLLLLLTVIATLAGVRQVASWMWVIIFAVALAGVIVLIMWGKPLW